MIDAHVKAVAIPNLVAGIICSIIFVVESRYAIIKSEEMQIIAQNAPILSPQTITAEIGIRQNTTVVGANVPPRKLLQTIVRPVAVRRRILKENTLLPVIRHIRRAVMTPVSIPIFTA